MSFLLYRRKAKKNDKNQANGDQMSVDVICPKCGHEHVHQTNVVVGIRDHEDSDTGLTVYVSNGTYSNGNKFDPKVDTTKTTEAVYSRRYSTKITFECEQCKSKFSHLFEQHAGRTLMSIEL